MKVYLIRHATAGDGATDQLRELTEKGRGEARGVGLGLRQTGIHLSAILSSPLLRARQTATLIAQCWDPVPVVTIREELSCGASPQAILALAREAGKDGEIALVGHNPDFSLCVATLLHPRPATTLRFSPASVCCLQIGEDSGVGLGWFLTPDELASRVNLPPEARLQNS